MITKLPFDILYLVIEYSNGKDLLYLSLTNKYYYQLLSGFRYFGSLLNLDYHSGIWPSLHLIENSINNDSTHSIQPMTPLQESVFEFSLITIESKVFFNYSSLPPSKRVNIIVNSEHEIDQMKSILQLERLGSLTFKVQVPEMIYFSLNKLVGLQLKDLNLSDCNITNDIIETLARNIQSTAIINMDLSRNRIRDDGILKLFDALPNTNIKELNVSMNLIERVGLKYVAERLPNTLLNSLDISFNNFEAGDISLLYEILSYTKLEILEGQITTLRSLLAIVTNLNKSSISSLNVEIREEYLERFLQCVVISNVKYLEFTGIEVQFNNKSAAILSKYIDKLPISHLKLNYCKFDSEHLCAILNNVTESSKLRYLDIWGLDQAGPQLGDCIKKMKLESLSINYSGLNDEALLNFVDNIGSLQYLDLSGNNLTVNGILLFIERVKRSNLLRLNLGFNIRDQSDLMITRKKIRKILVNNRGLSVHV
ncbi:hypothetical protein HDV06_002199 [Boothiomyces sp. JEL0866]|nr:hypothetical protein HDV06_002199 [Boothiomyces sp. JEL0866]